MYDSVYTLVCINRYQNQSALDSEGRTLITYAIERHAANCIKVPVIYLRGNCLVILVYHIYLTFFLPSPSSLQMLLTVNPHLLTLPDCHGSMPLHYASTKSSPEYIKLLTSHELPTDVNLDINCPDHNDHTPLHCAVACNRPQNAMVCIL